MRMQLTRLSELQFQKYMHASMKVLITDNPKTDNSSNSQNLRTGDTGNTEKQYIEFAVIKLSPLIIDAEIPIHHHQLLE